MYRGGSKIQHTGGTHTLRDVAVRKASRSTSECEERDEWMLDNADEALGHMILAKKAMRDRSSSFALQDVPLYARVWFENRMYLDKAIHEAANVGSKRLVFQRLCTLENDARRVRELYPTLHALSHAVDHLCKYSDTYRDFNPSSKRHKFELNYTNQHIVGTRWNGRRIAFTSD